MNVLFIGGTGLISTAIARQLIEAGHQVTLFNRGKSESRLTPGTYDVITGDRGDYVAFESAFDGRTFDAVVDMVAFKPADTESAIRAFKGKTDHFLHCSTVCVYSGPPQTIPTPETEPYHSIGGYGKNKIACEKLLLEAFEQDQFPATIMRPSHSYGEGGQIIRPWGPGDTFINRVRANKPLIAPGDGTGLWASCHVDDVARGFIGVLLNRDKTVGEAYNIAGDEYMTWNDYLETVADVAGGAFDLCYIPTDVLVKSAPKLSGGLHEIFAWPSIFNNDKIKRDTGYPGQTVSWRDGVKRTLAWLEENDKLKTGGPSDEYEDALIAAWRGGALASLPSEPAA